LNLSPEQVLCIRQYWIRKWPS